MAENWIPVPIDKALFANADADAVGAGYQTALENGFVTEQGVQSRFPGLIDFATLPNGEKGRVYLFDFGGDLIAGTSSGRLYRVNESGTPLDVTGVPISGGRRVIFAKSDVELFAAAGGPIVRLRGSTSELLSADAPLATHVGWIDGYVLAPEMDSQRWYHSGAGTPDAWDPLDVFSADGSPDNINSLLITPFREILFGGPISVEQFERLPTGTTAFFKRWAVGDGTKFPYCQVFADNAMWAINKLTEVVRFSGQLSQAASGDIGLLLESIDDWTDAWIGGYPDNPLHIAGQKFILLQAPRASNLTYGTKGITLLYDYRQKRWSTLYGWDDASGVPTRWPGWSHWSLWNRVFVGGEGKIYELKLGRYSNAGILQRWLLRTAHISQGNALQIKNFRVRIKRAVGGTASAPTIRVRCSRDARAFGPWISRSLGKAGDTIQFKEFGHFGTATSFQWEIATSDDCPVELMKVEVKADPVGH